MPSSVEPPNQTAPNKVPLIIKLFASGLFTGYAPIASGTVGSVLGLLIYCLPGFESPFVVLPTIVVCFVLGVFASTRMEAVYGNDPHEVVIDEIVGMWIALLFLPKAILPALISFFLFRLMDIIKPFPANKFNAMSGGFAVMMDDVIAGIYANVILELVFFIAARVH